MPPQIILPPKYYLTHFFEFLDFVEAHYAPVFEPDHVQFISDFRALSEDARCAYIRMVNRKGQIFERAGFLKYVEIADLESALSELQTEKFVTDLQKFHVEHLIYFLTKTKLRKWLLMNELEVPASLSRDEMVALALENQMRLDHRDIEGWDQLIVQARANEMEYLLFLYFGQIQKSLTLYTLRDLGIRKSHTLKTQFKPRYTAKTAAQAEYFFAKQLDLGFENKTDLHTLFEQATAYKNLQGSTQFLKDELLFALAEHTIEENAELAISALQQSRHPDAREKLVRLFYKLNRKPECLLVLDEIQEDPRTDQELLFAEDFSARKFNKKKIGNLTEMLKNAKEISLSDFFLKRPEQGVKEHYKAQGYNAYRTENWLWLGLFGILFWNELFESQDAAIHNPFERGPSDLVGEEFYERNSKSIEQTLSLLKDEKAINKKILLTITKNFGKLNDIFQWRTTLAESLTGFLRVAKKQDVALVLRSMAKKFATHHSGFPDLMVEKDGVVQFIEVKAEGDSLRANQLARLRLLKEAGFEVSVLKVKWVTDPNQTYVVVDVETTGGSGSFHRVTEVGAVKVQNGKVIDEFQTLINPGRAIPPFITGITGISNEMVANAPKFEDIAEKFHEFLEGAVFVAHNVKFDYGFIQREFSRSGIEFTRAQLCTCAGMRKTHPGLTSYSLKNLTAHFKIGMEQHHRALSDARAAAELLFLMNDKRTELPGESYVDYSID